MKKPFSPEYYDKISSHNTKTVDIIKVLGNHCDILSELIGMDVKKHFCIGGGALYSLYNDKDVIDYDFFGFDPEMLQELNNKFRNECPTVREGIHKGKFKGYDLLVTDQAITIGPYQIVTKYSETTPAKIVEQFDFKHNMSYYYMDKVHTLSSSSYLYSNTLWFNESRARDIANVLIRVTKFTQRGMKIRQFEYRKILRKLLEMSEEDQKNELLYVSQENKSTY